MSIFTSFNVNASGMTAERYRMDIISENVANMNTTRTEDGTPYRRKVVTFEEKGPKQGTFSSIFGTLFPRACRSWASKLISCRLYLGVFTFARLFARISFLFQDASAVFPITLI